ncbi:MAG: sulfotransferase family protein [Nitrososphaerales archaeon]
MILSSGDFALFPFESDTFALLGEKFHDLSSLKNRKRLMEFWLGSELFSRSGLDRTDIEPRVLRSCRNIGEFLRIVMEGMCRKQGVHRWAEKTPDHALYIREIKRSIPDSLVVHIIRDGRDAALSLANFGRIRPFFWERGAKLLSFGVYWKWMVRKARAGGQEIGRDYYELHYEDLVANPRETLAQLGGFIGHDLDYDRILQVGVGSVRRPETSFEPAASSEGFNPVGRWKRQYSPEDLARFESVVGDALEEMGYSLATHPQQRRRTLSTAAISAFYALQLESKLWLKSRTPLRRLVGRKRAL